ncbi:hypothetical protein T440DRAFT_7060 [Plenodomus tracheiphilus IPT5]|uniref:Uncharacterized protein n=1 Tax=Plenodomus tracheiphilus IPT5 TaxID=1408161 RepID=A0A6A7BNJ8_9PLEO|nr:hypothetical protein T440DRAFT_7060 [Plenodomus tracheiphilus IPT5]
MNVSKVSHWNPFRRYALGSIVEETSQSAPTTRNFKAKTCETTIDRVPSWPEEARPLKARTWLMHLYSFGDLILVMLPLFFILLGVAVITLNGKQTQGSAFGSKVEFAMNLSPTLFPIVFAAIIGRSMKMIARYMAEKGTKIATLELLMASQSVWGTVESQVLMQRLTVVGVNLLFLWALSPLGGQASLRLMTRDTRNLYSTVKLRYMTTGPAASMWGLSSTYIGSGKFADAGALYTAALLAPLSTKVGPRDPWGNVKIPVLEAVNSSLADSDGWISIPSTLPSPEAYSSLVGLPIVGLPSNDTTDLSLEYTYLSVDCKSFTQAPYPGLNNGTGNDLNTNFTQLEILAPGQVWFNKTEDNPFGNPYGEITTSFFLDTTRSYLDGIKEGADHDIYKGRLDGFFGNYNRSLLPETEIDTNRELLYVSQYSTGYNSNERGLNIATCSLTQKHVEAIVRCSGMACTTKKLRQSRQDNRPAALTGLEHGTILFSYAKQFPRAVTFRVGSSPTEHFLANSSAFPFVQQVGNLRSDLVYANFSLVSSEVFSRRLSVAMNTFYQLSMQPTGYFGSLSGNLSAYGPDTVPATDLDVYLPSNLSATNHTFTEWYSAFDLGIQDIDSPFIGATTSGKVTSTEQVFVCNFAWLTLLLLASSTTFLIGSSALILKHKTLGPELFGFVASMTYENPWVRVPDGGTMLDAMERARLLKDVEVRVGDVCGSDPVGHIAFAAGVPLRQLERGRLYC